MRNLQLNVNLLLRIGAIGIALLTLTTTSLANDSDRITQLENEVQQLKQRLSNLETLPSAASTSSKLLASSDGWKNLANWRSLKKGMNADEVRSVLGEPVAVQASGSLTFWRYAKAGDVTFYNERLHGWTEPR